MGLLPPVINSPTMEANTDYDQLMKEAQVLIARKDKIEEELRELEQVISASGVGMSESLIDSSGFPRAEIDVHSIRTSRNLIIRLRNDHRDVMSDIEKILHKIHEAKRQQQPEQVTEIVAPMPPPNLIAFAVVNAVAPDSPAYSAGLTRNDRILKFGHITSEYHERLQALNRLISTSENRPVPITVIRDGIRQDLVVTPRSGWGGRGTLGCHLLPL